MLIQQVLAGNDKAFDVLVARYRRAVYGWVRQTLPDTRYDQDLAQEAFVEAYFALDTLREHGKFGGWLRPGQDDEAADPGLTPSHPSRSTPPV